MEGDAARAPQGESIEISIHALRVEGDFIRLSGFPSLTKFLSTPSGWRATVPHVGKSGNVLISIHALRVEGDNARRRYAVEIVISIHALRVEGDSPLPL